MNDHCLLCLVRQVTNDDQRKMVTANHRNEDEGATPNCLRLRGGVAFHECGGSLHLRGEPLCMREAPLPGYFLQ